MPNSYRLTNKQITISCICMDLEKQMAPLASVEFVVDQSDVRGRAGANFLVEWLAETKVSEPIVEAIMAGSQGNSAFSFSRPDKVIESTTQE
jgi:hypothetical protein